MDLKLIKARLISFAYSVGTLLVLAAVGAFASPEFAAIVHDKFGDGVIATLILLVVTEGVKHVRNIAVLNSAPAGGEGTEEIVLI